MIDKGRVSCHIGAVLLAWDCLEIEYHPSVLLPNETAGTIWLGHQLHSKHIPWATDVGLPLERYRPEGESVYHYFKFWRVVHDSQEPQEDKACSGVVGPGSMWIEYVEGFTDPNDWYISEVLGAAYEKQYELTSMKYVFVENIVDKETQEFCLTELFTDRNGLSWPPLENRAFVSNHSSAEFRALLGTPIGRVVAILVLAAYGQGVRRIASIVVFRTGFMVPHWNMRFDLEDIRK
jgi:hypothetical protein